MKEIPEQLLRFAKYISPSLTPNNRIAGWRELDTEIRGNGDLMDLIGTLYVFDRISKNGKVCRINITCGIGDEFDLEILVNGDFKKVNIKTSSYVPFKSGLNLIVKKEEVDKDIDAYIQLFVHLDETDVPHIHVGGWIPTISKRWLEAKDNLVEIPRTNGHMGVKIPIEHLGSLDKLISMIDDKF
jgi:hypothetical protein